MYRLVISLLFSAFLALFGEEIKVQSHPQFSEALAEVFVNKRTPTPDEIQMFISGGWAAKEGVTKDGITKDGISREVIKYWFDHIMINYSLDPKSQINVRNFLYVSLFAETPGWANAVSLASHEIKESISAKASNGTEIQYFASLLWTMLVNYNEDDPMPYGTSSNPSALSMKLKDIFIYDYTKNTRPTHKEIRAVYTVLRGYATEHPEWTWISMGFLSDKLSKAGVDLSLESGGESELFDTIDSRHLLDCMLFGKRVDAAQLRIENGRKKNLENKITQNIFDSIKVKVISRAIEDIEAISIASDALCKSFIFGNMYNAAGDGQFILAAFEKCLHDKEISSSDRGREKVCALCIKILIDVSRWTRFQCGRLHIGWIEDEIKNLRPSLSDGVIRNILDIETSRFVTKDETACARYLAELFSEKNVGLDVSIQYLIKQNVYCGSPLFYSLSSAQEVVRLAMQRAEMLSRGMANPSMPINAKIELLHLYVQLQEYKKASDTIDEIRKTEAIKDKKVMDFIDRVEEKLRSIKSKR